VIDETKMRPILLVLAIICSAYILAQAQSAVPADHSAKSRTSKPGKPELLDVKREPASVASTLTLKDVGPLNPEEAARATARNLVKQKNSEETGQAGQKKDQGKVQTPGKSKPVSDAAVLEFHSAGEGSGNSSTAAVAGPARQGKSPAKRVHGDLYGAKSGIGNAEGGSVGATSKSGKTSVYVESDQVRSTVPQHR
jgi:hypothetical protein